MDIEKQILIAKGTIRHLPGIDKLMSQPKTGGTNESRYCYSVWMRHLVHWSRFRKYVPDTVAELGPGDSLGTGLAALLAGCNRLFELDVIKYWSNERNLKIFEELIELFRKKTPIPDATEYPRLKPYLSDYGFPAGILSNERLEKSLSDNRISEIRREIQDIDNPSNRFIKYKIPWHNSEVINFCSVDFIYSQAALECIDELDSTFDAMNSWLKPNGLMSHTIDFKSHGLTSQWNGHWKFNEFEWSLAKGGRSFLVNRKTLSDYMKLHEKYGFRIYEKEPVKTENLIPLNSLSKRYRSLPENEITTSGIYIISEKGQV
jgi:hypothetical protein